ncbi:hypothetical protein FACS1894113_3170 [Alphaproteobacteria bacterium]|nr:hypothetical protein FACS1894113_3170 [Alphaproteobacteria bacterium]
MGFKSEKLCISDNNVCIHEHGDFDKIDFWTADNNTKNGANIFNIHVLREDIQAAKKYGIRFIRLSPDKFPSKKRDFLIGNADNYENLDAYDLDLLKSVIGICEDENMPAVLTMLSLPGSRMI